MSQRVLILGGCGRIGSAIATDVLRHTAAEVVCTSRRAAPPSHWNRPVAADRTAQFCQVDLADRPQLRAAIAQADLVIHCAGPFHDRDGRVLQACIDETTHYLDVSDNRRFTEAALALHPCAEAAGITALINTGVFPGISNCIAALAAAELDQVQSIHLDYLVAGSGGAGRTVFKTTFLGIIDAFPAWINGQWQQVSPYHDRFTVTFPPPYGTAGVYWYEVPETMTLVQAFPGVQTVTTRFGSLPDLYNRLTQITAQRCPKSWLRNPAVLNALTRISQQMTRVSDRWSGVGVSIRVEAQGQYQGSSRTVITSINHPHTAIAVAVGTGTIAAWILNQGWRRAGVWTPEQGISLAEFKDAMDDRQIQISTSISDSSIGSPTDSSTP